VNLERPAHQTHSILHVDNPVTSCRFINVETNAIVRDANPKHPVNDR
jgi:hypothetical protein